MNKKLTKHLAPGHSTCAGCGIPAIVRTVLGATEDPVIVANATGCLEVTTTIYPYTAWKVPYIHNAFENAAATISGVEAAQNALEKKALRQAQGKDPSVQAQGKDPSVQAQGKEFKKAKLVVFGGDGGTYDIGLQSLSGALERGHDFLYVCYDNGGYMNTGGQRSGATPYGASTETEPSGEQSFGKSKQRKDLMEIVAAHGVKYLAQANVANLRDLEMKAKKALETSGPTFLLVMQPCTQIWKFPTSQYVNVGKLAMETNFWPLYEIEDGKYKINYINENPKPIEQFLETQGRFKHLLKPKRNDTVIDQIQQTVNENVEKLKKKVASSE